MKKKEKWYGRLHDNKKPAQMAQDIMACTDSPLQAMTVAAAVALAVAAANRRELEEVLSVITRIAVTSGIEIVVEENIN